MWKARLMGLFASAAGVAYIFFYFFNLVAPWLCVIIIPYTIALIFMFNSTYQEISSGVKLSKVNLSFAVLFFLATLGLLAFSFFSGNLTL